MFRLQTLTMKTGVTACTVITSGHVVTSQGMFITTTSLCSMIIYDKTSVSIFLDQTSYIHLCYTTLLAISVRISSFGTTYLLINYNRISGKC